MSTRMLTLTAVFVLSLPGCDKKQDSEAGEDAGSAEGAEGAREDPGSAEEDEGTRLEEAIDEEVETETGKKNFTKGMAKKGCELLPPSLVASTFDVPEDELEQMKMMGCIYNWKSGDQVLEANLTLAKAHDSVEEAKQWFKNSTASKTEDEIKAEMEQVKKKVKEKEEMQGKVKQKAADSLMGAAMEMAGPIKYEDVEGVGDEARVNQRDGAMWVRVGNLTFSIAAYKGPKMPKPDYAGMKPKELVAVSKKANKEWMAKTLEQRQADAIKLAKHVVAEL